MKYGCTGCFRTRILGDYLGGIGGATTQRIHEELFEYKMIGRVEIAWIETKDKAEAKLKETRFRKIYKANHEGQRPAWDLCD